MIAKTQKLILESVLLGLVLTTCLAMPAATIRDEDSYPREYLPLQEEEMTQNAEFQEALYKLIHGNEHAQLRKMLKLVIRLLDNEQETFGEEDLNTPEMPFYFDHVKSLVNGEVSQNSLRRHRKRSSFDSISHNGGLGGLGGTHTRKKLEFTFENLLPYLIQEMQRNNRSVPRTDH